MRKDGRIMGDGYRDILFESNGKWYHIKDADMSHLEDAVTYWNRRGGYFGPKSKEVRAWMKDPDNYELEYYSTNRSRGGSTPERYRDPGGFVGPAEQPNY